MAEQAANTNNVIDEAMEAGQAADHLHPHQPRRKGKSDWNSSK
jgi:hypothetical protein